MKEGGPDHMGGGDFSAAKSYADMKADHRQHLVDIELARNERIQSRGVDEVKVDQHLTSLRNLGRGRTIEEVDKILGNTDVADLDKKREEKAQQVDENEDQQVTLAD